MAMFDNCSLVEEKIFIFKCMGAKENNHDHMVILNGTTNGFEVVLKIKNEIIKLQTQRKKIRYFKSPSTAINYLAGIGVERLCVEGLDNWTPDSYVNANSKRRARKDAEQ